MSPVNKRSSSYEVLPHQLHPHHLCLLSGLHRPGIVNNFAPLLFLTLSASFGLALEQIALFSTVNFAIQLCVDLLSAKVIDRVGYRASIIAAHAFAAAGIAGLAVFPALLGSAFAGLLLAVLLSTVFFTLFGIENWRVLAVVWAIIPILNLLYFTQAPIYPIAPDQKKSSLGGCLLSRRTAGHPSRS